MTDKVSIMITDMRLPKFVRRVLALTAIIVVPISIGILMDSSAMQWIGFVFAMLTVVGFSLKTSKDETFTSIADARERLDELERQTNAEGTSP